MEYYGEYPYAQFNYLSDEEALSYCESEVLYRENETTSDGLPFVFLRNLRGQKH